jgi:hypothetical protein
MKLATRLALLQWQANPADPSNLWRLIIAWVTPGIHEPEDENAIDWRKNPYRQPGGNSDPLRRAPPQTTGRAADPRRISPSDYPRIGSNMRRFAVIMALSTTVVAGTVAGTAWFFRYEPMPEQQGIWLRVWDRWKGQVCLTPRPGFSNIHGIACSQSEVNDLLARMRAEAAARTAAERAWLEGDTDRR